MTHRDPHVDALNIRHPYEGLEEAGAVTLRPLQVKMPGLSAAKDPPRLLVGGRRPQADHFQRPGVGAGIRNAQRHSELLPEEETLPRQAPVAIHPAAEFPVAGAFQISDAADGGHGRQFLPFSKRYLFSKPAFIERAAQPATSQPEVRGQEDDPFQSAAVIFQIFIRPDGGAGDETSFVADEAVRSEPPQGIAVRVGGGQKLKTER